MHGTIKAKHIEDSRALFCHLPHYHESMTKPAGAVRLGNYKLIEWYERNSCDNSTPLELYDLSNDPGETQNLAQAQAEKSAELLHRLRGWRKKLEHKCRHSMLIFNNPRTVEVPLLQTPESARNKP